jgi:ABC-type antimicrobial peptide transport system permease subunit
LLAGGAGFLFSLRNLSAVPTGFDACHVAVLSISNDFSYSDRDRQLGATGQLEARVAALGTVFAGLGLVLAGFGLYGLLNYSVTRRTGEIGIRAALGASRRSLYALVFQELAGILAVGAAAGLAGALALMRMARTVLYGVETVDPWVIGAAAAVLVGAALLAGGLPARRIAAIDPIAAIRHP